MEIEAKYLVSQEDFDFWRKTILNSKNMGDWERVQDSFETVSMESCYLDSVEGTAFKRGGSLRIRRENERLVFTIKQKLAQEGARSTRHEWEAALKSHVIDEQAFAEADEQVDQWASEDEQLASFMEGVRITQTVKIADIRFERLRSLWRNGDELVEWSLDQGRFVDGEDRHNFAEMELELKAGNSDSIFELEKLLNAKRELQEEQASKLSRYMTWKHGRNE